MTKAIFSKDHKYTIEQLKKARIEAGLDQADVAKLLSKTQPHISKIEAGQRRLDITQLKEFAKIYKNLWTILLNNNMPKKKQKINAKDVFDRYFSGALTGASSNETINIFCNTDNNYFVKKLQLIKKVAFRLERSN